MRLNSRCLSLLICLDLAWGLSAGAEPRTVQKLSVQAFDALETAKLDPKILYYGEKILTFDEWSQQSPLEFKALALYNGYIEPTVTVIKNTIPRRAVEKLMIYLVRTKTVLKKAGREINLSQLINLETVRKFDPELEVQPIQHNQFMSAVAGKGPVNNFKWGNCKGAIERPQRELELSYTNPKTRSWCNDPSRSICVEACYRFGAGWSNAVLLNNLMVADEASKKDYGVGLQAEIRYFETEKDLELNAEQVASLTGIKTPVRGVGELNLFYFNQVFEFGKVIAILQDHPSISNQTIVTSFFVMGIKKRTWDLYAGVQKIIIGESKANTETGISAGVPIFTQNIIKAIGNILEN